MDNNEEEDAIQDPWVGTALASFYIDRPRSDIEAFLRAKKFLNKKGLPTALVPDAVIHLENEDDLIHVSFQKKWLFDQFEKNGWGKAVSEKEFQFRLSVWRLGVILFGYQEERGRVLDLSVETHHPDGGYRKGILAYLDQSLTWCSHGVQASMILDRLRRFPLSEETLKVVEAFMPLHVLDQAKLENQTSSVIYQKNLNRL